MFWKFYRIEMILVRKNIYLRGFQVAINLFISKFTVYTLVVVYALEGNPVLPEKVLLIYSKFILFQVQISRGVIHIGATGESG